MAVETPCGEFRTSYAAERSIFRTRNSARAALLGILVAAAAPALVNSYFISILIQIGYFSIAALGLNVLVGLSGQISIGHAAFYGFGGFASVFISSRLGVPVPLSVLLAGFVTSAAGLIFALPALRIKGLYLAIATLAAQAILEDFFARAGWFTGGASGVLANPYEMFGFAFDSDRSYYYVVLAHLLAALLLVSNLQRTRVGRAFVAVRDHYLSAEMMGINLAEYRLLAFLVAAFFAGIGGALQAHYLQFVSIEGITLMLSVQFLAMIIIGGLGSVSGTVMGATFIVLLPQVLNCIVTRASELLHLSFNLVGSLPLIREMATGLAIMLFLALEPEGLARRWRRIKTYWKVYPFGYQS